MADRAAPATEAMIVRAIRAAQKCGLKVKALVPRRDGVAIEFDYEAPLVIGDGSSLDNWRAGRGAR
jgi:hypothetical protein